MNESSIWTEKYRPSTFEEIKGQKEIVEKIKAFVQTKNMPHLLFSGPAGVGKTTLSLVIAKQLYGDSWRENTLELNASVTPDTPILVKINGAIKRTNFEELAKVYYDESKEKYQRPEDLEIFCLDKNKHSVFKKVSLISRHKVDKLINIRYEGGNVKTSLNHSVIVINEKGDLVPKKAEELRKGDLLVTFKEEIEGNQKDVDLSLYRSQEKCFLVSGDYINPKLKINYPSLELKPEISWMLGMYLAEGCVNFNKRGSSGQIIFVLNNPAEVPVVNRINEVFKNNFSLNGSTFLGSSGFNRNKKSSIQLRILNTQLARFFANNFYTSHFKNALSKKVPSFLFDSSSKSKKSFLEGYTGDATGRWNEYLRYTSKSKNALVDVTWLGRISGLETTYFKTEARIVWGSGTYTRSNLLPAEPLLSLIRKNRADFPKDVLNSLRHQLYSKKSKRLQKELIKSILSKVNTSKIKAEVEKINNLVNSPLYVVKITSLKLEDYKDYVYDVSVPGLENFWGGTAPILLHNSDERGIDVVRVKVKDFARTKSIGNIPFKLIYLDESDALTKEAQQALRRTMENYTQTCRFILSCNYSSKIIDPIQSRCAIFRFKPLSEEEIYQVIDKVTKQEGLKVSTEAKKALFDISEGDCRRLENIMQSCAVINKSLDPELVYSMASVAKPKEVKEVLTVAAKGNFLEARKKLLSLMLDYGLSGIDVIKQIQKEIWHLELSDRQKVELIDKCGETEFRMTEGSDEYLQIESFLAYVVLVGSKK